MRGDVLNQRNPCTYSYDGKSNKYELFDYANRHLRILSARLCCFFAERTDVCDCDSNINKNGLVDSGVSGEFHLNLNFRSLPQDKSTNVIAHSKLSLSLYDVLRHSHRLRRNAVLVRTGRELHR